MPPPSVVTKLVIAIVLFLVGTVMNHLPILSWFNWIAFLGGLVVSVLACVEWSRSKGLNPLFGLLGLIVTPILFFFPIGWIILFLIPAQQTTPESAANGGYPS